MTKTLPFFGLSDRFLVSKSIFRPLRPIFGLKIDFSTSQIRFYKKFHLLDWKFQKIDLAGLKFSSFWQNPVQLDWISVQRLKNMSKIELFSVQQIDFSISILRSQFWIQKISFWWIFRSRLFLDFETKNWNFWDLEKLLENQSWQFHCEVSSGFC